MTKKRKIVKIRAVPREEYEVPRSRLWNQDSELPSKIGETHELLQCPKRTRLCLLLRQSIK